MSTDIVDPGATPKAPVEGKVWGATIGAGSGTVVSTFVLWILGAYLWGGPIDANAATETVARVPAPVAGLVILLLTIGGTFTGGFITKHSPRAIPEEVVVPVLPTANAVEIKTAVPEPTPEELDVEDVTPLDSSEPDVVLDGEDGDDVLTEDDAAEEVGESEEDFEPVENPDDARKDV